MQVPFSCRGAFDRARRRAVTFAARHRAILGRSEARRAREEASGRVRTGAAAGHRLPARSARARRCSRASTTTRSSSAPTPTPGGGVCPMLAAHRHGGRTSLASFASAWDRYTGAGSRPRPATERELRTLTRDARGVACSTATSELAAAAADHRARSAKRTARRAEARHGRASRALKELRERPGWAWLRVFRRYDDFQAALAQAESEEKAKRTPTSASASSSRSYIASPGRMNRISGTMQAGEVRSRKRTASAMSSGPDHVLGRDLALGPVGHRRVDEPGRERGHLDPVAGELAVRGLRQPDHARLGGRVGREPRLALHARDRRGVHHQRLAGARRRPPSASGCTRAA